MVYDDLEPGLEMKYGPGGLPSRTPLFGIQGTEYLIQYPSPLSSGAQCLAVEASVFVAPA
jgi:hypothetical protein